MGTRNTADISLTMLVSCTRRELHRPLLPPLLPPPFLPARARTDDSDDDAINTEEKVWDLTQSINVKGVWYGCKHAIPAMRNVRA